MGLLRRDSPLPSPLPREERSYFLARPTWGKERESEGSSNVLLDE